MRPAIAPLRHALARIPTRATTIPVVSNGRVLREDVAVREALVEALTGRVRWVAVLDALQAAGVTDHVVLGPGKQLAAWLVARGARVHRTDRAIDVRATAAALGSRPR